MSTSPDGGRVDVPPSLGRRQILCIAAGWPLLACAGAAFGQSKKPPVLIGWLSSGSSTLEVRTLEAFKEGMAGHGWKGGSNYVLEERWAEGRRDRLSSFAEELAARKPALIVAAPLLSTAAAAKAAPQIPIVQANGNSPVAAGLAASLARPGGMVTGVTNIVDDLSEKYLELLLAAAPKVRRVGFLVDRMSIGYATQMKNARRAVEYHRVEARFAEVAAAEDLDPAISRFAKDGVQGLVLLPSPGLFNTERRRIIRLALAHRWPVVAPVRSLVDEGALLTYGPNRLALFRRAAFYVDRILKGAKPGDLPIEQPTQFELVVNMKTATALGLTVPPSIMVQATTVIE